MTDGINCIVVFKQVGRCALIGPHSVITSGQSYEHVKIVESLRIVIFSQSDASIVIYDRRALIRLTAV